jgi:hypothetical protein
MVWNLNIYVQNLETGILGWIILCVIYALATKPKMTHATDGVPVRSAYYCLKTMTAPLFVIIHLRNRGGINPNYLPDVSNTELMTTIGLFFTILLPIFGWILNFVWNLVFQPIFI